jgi:hypothetical protein
MSRYRFSDNAERMSSLLFPKNILIQPSKPFMGPEPAVLTSVLDGLVERTYRLHKE